MHINIDTSYLDSEHKDFIKKNFNKASDLFQQNLKENKHYQNDTGWFDWPQQHGFNLIKTIKNSIDNLEVYYDCIVLIATGGSLNTTVAVSSALQQQVYSQPVNKTKPIICLGHHLDELIIKKTLKELELLHPIVIVVSKSGSTLEPNILWSIVDKHMNNIFGEDETIKRTILITDPEKGFLRKASTEKKYLSFEIPQDIGGRFSALTAPSLVPLALSGIDISMLMQGASNFFAEINDTKNLNDHPCLVYALLRNFLWDKGKTIELMVANTPILMDLIEWWKQLYAESEGKDNKGIFPAGALYTKDLHSLGQFIQQGNPILFETFLEFDNHNPIGKSPIESRLRVPTSDSFYAVTKNYSGFLLDDINKKINESCKKAHSKRNIPCISLRLKQIDEFNLGYLLSFFMTSCSISAMLADTNPYNQPGVEGYKEEVRNIFI
jgi:glucose-6-phosphate isomerase